MKKINHRDNGIICSRLAIERCQKYLAHLHAIMFMCEPADLGLDEVMAENARRLMGAINQELTLSIKTLAAPSETGLAA